MYSAPTSSSTEYSHLEERGRRCARMMQTSTTVPIVLGGRCAVLFLISAALLLVLLYGTVAAVELNRFAYQQGLTPLQLEIEKQKLRLNSLETEERRDAAMRLGALGRAEASRAALSALADPSSIVRVAAANAVLFLPADESVAVLIPLLNDRDPFVRQEVAYSLGGTHNSRAVAALVERLTTDKDDGVRGAAAVALGTIHDEVAVLPLAQVLSPAGLSSRRARKRKTRENEFVLRAAARSLGKIGSRAGAPALIQVLTNDALASDIRREAALGLGLIGDPAAIPALQAATSGDDPHLSQIAFESLRRIASTKSRSPS